MRPPAPTTSTARSTRFRTRRRICSTRLPSDVRRIGSRSSTADGLPPALARAQLLVRDDMGDLVGADPRLRALRRRAGGRLEAGDRAPPPGRLAKNVGGRLGARRRLVVVLVRFGRARALALPQGR